jgi:hypothetical protein|tara:strand:- start:39 stop:263 length:225 start_codon:yes stop_codon:yes gene_type:complete
MAERTNMSVTTSKMLLGKGGDQPWTLIILKNYENLESVSGLGGLKLITGKESFLIKCFRNFFFSLLRKLFIIFC